MAVSVCQLDYILDIVERRNDQFAIPVQRVVLRHRFWVTARSRLLDKPYHFVEFSITTSKTLASLADSIEALELDQDLE